MSGRQPRRVALTLALCAAVTGCGGTARSPAGTAAGPPLSPATSLAGEGAAWAVVPMGAASGPNEFWQLFTLPTSGGRWSLVTPPYVPTNGALALAGPAGPAVTVGVRPALGLRYSPLTTTTDTGHHWTALPSAPGLASVPDALASSGGQLLALNRDGRAELTRGGTAAWTTLTTDHALAATPAGRGCGLAGLTAAAFSPTAQPLLGGVCTRPGVAGIFERIGETWRAAGPSLPAALAHHTTEVLRLTRTSSGITALLAAGTGRTATLIAGWSADNGHWTLSPPLPLRGRHVMSASFGGGAAALVLSGNHGETLTSPTATWRPLPPLPYARTVTLALPPSGGTTALAATGSTLTIWRLTPTQTAWAKAQVIHVPIQYGSST